MTLPSLKQKIISEFITVYNLCATVTDVLSLAIISNVFYISASLVLSKAEVASSKIKKSGFLINDLAIAILYF